MELELISEHSDSINKVIHKSEQTRKQLDLNEEGFSDYVQATTFGPALF